MVTGKGGTGKTTVAAALALALTRQGKRVLLAEVEGRQGISQTFDVPPLGHTETRILQRPQRRPAVGDLGRRQGLAARVPPEVLQGRQGDDGARPVRCGRLRDDHRARGARRAAHRQGLRGGGPPHRQGPGGPGLRRRRARRPAHRPGRAVPQRQRRGRRRRARSARSAPRPTRSPGCSAATRPPSTS